MTLPHVTVVTPLYNYETFIDRCIESVLAQTYPHIDMIVVDDGSSDQGPERVMKYEDKGVKLLRQKRNAYGVSRAMNTAIAHAKGEMIQWLSADDYFAPDKIEKCVKAYLDAPSNQWAGVHTDLLIETRDPNVLLDPQTPFGALAQHNHEFLNTLQRQGSVGLKAESKAQTPGQFMKDLLFQGPQINGCALLASKSVYQGVGGFQECWSLTHDTELWARMALKGYSFLPLNEPLVISEHHETNSNRYRWDVPAELNILSRYLALIMDFNLISDIYSGKYSDWCWDLIHHFVKLQAWDSVSYWLNQYEASGGSAQSTHVLKSKIHEKLPKISAPSTRAKNGFAIYVTHRDTWRIKDVLTQFFDAFSSENMSLYIGLESPDYRERVQEQINYALAFLDIPQSQLCCFIHFLDQPDPCELLQYAVFYIPLADQTIWESRCLHVYQTFGHVVYNPEAPVLKRFARVTPYLKDLDKTQSLQWAMHLHADSALRVSSQELILSPQGLFQLHPNPFREKLVHPLWATHEYVKSQFEDAIYAPPAFLEQSPLMPEFPEHILGPFSQDLICFWLNKESASYLAGTLETFNRQWSNAKVILFNELCATDLDQLVSRIPEDLELEIYVLELMGLGTEEYRAILLYSKLLILALPNGQTHQNLVNDVLVFQGSKIVVCHEYDATLKTEPTHFPLLSFDELLSTHIMSPKSYLQKLTGYLPYICVTEPLSPDQVYKKIQPRLSQNDIWPGVTII